MADSNSARYIGDYDFEKVHFGPLDQSNNKMKVEVFQDASSLTNKNKFQKVQLCKDAMHPIRTKFQLDSVRDDGNPNRRGLTLVIDDPDTVVALKSFDDVIVQKAIQNSKEWFKKTLNEEQIRARYKPIISPFSETDSDMVMKIKVKCGSADVPTVLHHCQDDGYIHKRGGKLADLTRGAKVVPVVSCAYGLWFMGGGMQFGLSFQAEQIIVTPGEEYDELAMFKTSAPLRAALHKSPEEDTRAHMDTEEKVELVEDDGGPM